MMQVLPQVKAYHDSIGVPFGHWQFDSWFYPKDGGVNAGGGGGAVVNWTAMPSVFPHGMAYIQSKLQLPTVMHNRQWSTKSDYIKHLDYKWYTSKYAMAEVSVEVYVVLTDTVDLLVYIIALRILASRIYYRCVHMTVLDACIQRAES